jgi:hypothetical protein
VQADQMQIEQAQKAVCKQFGADFVPPLPDAKIGLANSTAGRVPINGLRPPRPSEPAAATYGVGSPSPKHQTSLSRDMHTTSMMSVMKWFDCLDCHPDGDSYRTETTLPSGLTLPYRRPEQH